MKGPLNVTFLWHMHQPYYRNIETDKFILPWVRMHAVKDYYDMAAILEKYPKIRQNFNLVPSLLLQLEEYSAGTTDIFMDLTLKPASELNEDERVFVLFNFFMANWGTMVYPHARYAYLLKKRGENTNPDEIKKFHASFTEQEIRDLQVWFNLCWIDPDFFDMFADLKAIKEKGEEFTEEEKRLVITRHLDIIKMIVPKYREMQEKGSIELSTTPFYHPILPLLCDTDIAKQCLPGFNPDFKFSHPEDAEAQVRKGLDYFNEKFGKRPQGMWPSEGSVSGQVVEMLAGCGVKWAATDEEILKESMRLSGINPDASSIYRPYAVNTSKGAIKMVFRNHFLSDLIGFTYQGWNPREAADNLIHELYRIRETLEEGCSANIMLDGENCWEYYSNDGKDFLNALYEKLSANRDFECVTISEAIERAKNTPELPRIFPGSWINHDFYIWIGHEQDKKSWKLLKKTRDALVEWERTNPHEKEKLARAWESLYVAEGSDWNWWYGDDHSSKNDTEFDNLYRLHLMNAYSATGREVPSELYVPIGTGSPAFELPPSRFISPEIDGLDTGYFEWKGAGVHDLEKEGGAMHKAEKFIKEMRYGFDMERLYLRFDSEDGLKDDKEALRFRLDFFDGVKKASLEFDASGAACKAEGLDTAGARFAAVEIAEAAVPFANMAHLAENREIKIAVYVIRQGVEVQRIPEKGLLHVQVPDADFGLYNWKA